MIQKKFTKSRFKTGIECATKLFYGDNKAYQNSKQDDDFLRSLAEGGYQVGALAKYMFKTKGVEVLEKDYTQSVANTKTHLENADINHIFEAAFEYKELFVRADIVSKNTFGGLDLIEVKAKSIDSSNYNFYNREGKIASEWQAYLMDVAFQKYVLEKATNLSIRPFLMLADKSKNASIDGLNQYFKYKRKGDNIVVDEPDHVDIGVEVLVKIDVSAEIDYLFQSTFTFDKRDYGFEEYLLQLQAIFASKAPYRFQEINASACGGCEFKSSNPNQLSGFHECWKHYTGLDQATLEASPLVYQVWNYRNKVSQIQDKNFFIKDIALSEFEETTHKTKLGLSAKERQALQVQKVIDNDTSIYLDIDNLRFEIEQFTYPLHFIDFETSAVAIPFNRGLRPYEQTAFQFSHHILREDGTITHQTEWLNTTPGKFPNFDFVRALKACLDKDNGTIFRFAPHENTILRAIYRQLNASTEMDKLALMDWIDTITQDKDKRHKGARNMVDMCVLVKDYHYDPATKGSNSIKAVLPAVLNASAYLKQKYSQAIYGTSTIPSKNFKDFTWIKLDEQQKVTSPYKHLPKIFEGYDIEEDLFTDAEELANGGAAMTAYAKMQFTEMSTSEREALSKGLLKYCELDTLAMVMIFEYWLEEIRAAGN